MTSDSFGITIFQHPFHEGSSNSHKLLERSAQLWADRPKELGPLKIGPWGKPAFEKDGVHFSITHSGAYWMCAFSKYPVGLDLQIHALRYDAAKLSRRFFHPAEDAWLARGSYQRFFDIWAAKESYVKFTGRGFSQDPETFSVVSSWGCFPFMEGLQLRLLPFGPDYSLCLCAMQIETVRICILP